MKLGLGRAGQEKTPADAYDRVAATYDETLAADEAERRRLWARYDAVFPAGSRVLDLGCGTGIDTIHLAERGVEVVAVDVSEGMLAVLREKLVRRPELRVDVRRLAFDELGSVEGPFDGVVSAFAALNTVDDLRPIGRELARLVRPGGTVVVHLLTRWRVRDALRHLLRGRPGDAASALRRRRAFRVGDGDVVHYRHHVRSLARAWPHLRLVEHRARPLDPFFVATFTRRVAPIRSWRGSRRHFEPSAMFRVFG